MLKNPDRSIGSVTPCAAADAQNDLEEALGYAVDIGYRLLEADIRLGLAKVFQAMGDYPAARSEAEIAWRLSSEMGYYGGRIEVEAVSAALEKSTSQS